MIIPTKINEIQMLGFMSMTFYPVQSDILQEHMNLKKSKHFETNSYPCDISRQIIK